MNQSSRKDKAKGVVKKRKPPPEAAEIMMGLMSLAMVVEAAGGLDRAIAYGAMNDHNVEELRRIVPASRGGQNRMPEAEAAWVALLEQAMKEPMAREMMARMQRDMARGRPPELLEPPVRRVGSGMYDELDFLELDEE